MFFLEGRLRGQSVLAVGNHSCRCTRVSMIIISTTCAWAEVHNKLKRFYQKRAETNL